MRLSYSHKALIHLFQFRKGYHSHSIARTIVTRAMEEEESRHMQSQPKVTLCQMTTTDSIDVTLSCIERFAHKAASEGSCMMFLPENATYMGTSSDASLAVAERLDDIAGTKLHRIRDICKRHKMWMSLGGFQEIADTDEHGKTTKVYNSHLIIDDDGQIVSVYRKIHLFDMEYTPKDDGTSDKSGKERKIQLKESSFTKPGQGLCICDSPAGRLGLSVCFDLRFPEVYQKLRYDMGAQVILIPAAFTVPTGEAHWKTLLKARAIETQTFVIASAQSGKHNARRESYGHSMIIDPWGNVIACLDETSPACVTVPIDLDAIESIRMRIPMDRSRSQGRSRYD